MTTTFRPGGAAGSAAGDGPAPGRAAVGARGASSRRLALVLLALGTVVGGWCAAGIGVRATHGARLTADEPQYVLSAISLAEDRDLDIADELADERWRDFHEVDLPLQTRVLDGGRQLSPHDPLLPVVLALPVAAAGWVGAKLLLAAMAGGLAALLAWILHRRAGVDLRVAVAGVAVFALSPPVAVYGTQVYPELPAALAVAAGIAVLTGPVRRGAAPVLGLAAVVVALPWLSVKYVPVAVALAAVGAVRLGRAGERRALVQLLTVLTASAVVYVVAHRLLYGGWTVYAAGDHFVDGETTVMGHDPDLAGRSRRLAGLLTDRDFGLLAWQPAFVLAVPAVAALVARAVAGRGRATTGEPEAASRLAAPVVVPLAAGWFVATFAALTMHGWWWPGRQVVVVVPALVVATVWWAARTPARTAVLLVAGAAGMLTFAFLVVEGTAGSLTWVSDFATTSSPVHGALRPLLPDGRSGASAEVARHVAWVALLLALATAGWRTAHR